MNERRIKNLIVFSVFFSAAAAVAYEILAATILTNLLGASVYYFSLIIGFFLAALGVGSWFSKKIKKNLFENLISIEIIIAILGGSLSILIYGGYVFIFEILREISFGDIFSFFFSILFAELIFLLLALLLVSLVGVLAGFELPLYSRIFAEREILKDALGRVFFWDYIGALVISILLPLFFFVNFGIIKTSFLMGFMNAFAALLLMIVSKLESIRLKTILKFGVIIALFVNILGFFMGGDLELFLERRRYGDREVIYHDSSPYQSFSFVRSVDGKVSLYINGQRQFEAGDWDTVYHESFVHPSMAAAKNRKKILVLGGGDGLALREVLKYNDISNVVLVDIDVAIVKASSELEFMRELNHSSFGDSRVSVVIDDAFKFVERNRLKNTFNLIFVDFPDPSDDSLSRLYSKEFYLMLRDLLSDDGMLVIQGSGYLDPVHRTIIETVKSVGLNVIPYHPPRYDILDQNFGFTLVSKYPISSDQFENLIVPIETKLFDSYSLGYIFNPVPIQKREAQIKMNSIFRPTIVSAYGNIFAAHYIESQPKEKILKQIELTPEEVRAEFIRLFYKQSATGF